MQMTQMKEALHCLDSVEIYALDFDCDIDSKSDSPAATNQEKYKGLQLHSQLTTNAVSIDCHLHSLTVQN